MRTGASPSVAAAEAIKPIIKYYPQFIGAVVAANTQGEHSKYFNKAFKLYVDRIADCWSTM